MLRFCLSSQTIILYTSWEPSVHSFCFLTEPLYCIHHGNLLCTVLVSCQRLAEWDPSFESLTHFKVHWVIHIPIYVHQSCRIYTKNNINLTVNQLSIGTYQPLINASLKVHHAEMRCFRHVYYTYYCFILLKRERNVIGTCYIRILLILYR